MAASASVYPLLVVFDLDACVWFPEMYHLWDKKNCGPPFAYDAAANACVDQAGTVVRLLGAIPEVFDEVGQWACGDHRIAIASRTDEPAWAREILGKFRTAGGATLLERVDLRLVEMYKGSKRDHLAAIARKSGVGFEGMLFFDDDPINIKDVSSLGVVSILTPHGVTREAFEAGLIAFAKARE